MQSPRRLLTAEQSRQLDEWAQNQAGLPGLLLMKRAAWHAWQCAQQQFPSCQEVDILCGSGNNGGDGFALAQWALLSGKTVRIWLASPPDTLQGDAKICFQEAYALGLRPQLLEHFNPKPQALLVDALFGTGLNRPLSSEHQQQFAELNRLNLPVLALDSPSGLDCSNGHPLGVVLKARHTCSFLGEKLGHFSGQGPDYCGQIHFFDLGCPADLTEQFTQAVTVHGLAHWHNHFPASSAADHKGRTGTNLLIGGQTAMQGALQIAASGALHSGAGLVFTYQPHPSYTGLQPEIQYRGGQGDELIALIPKANAIAIGPGLGQDSWAQQSLRHVLQHSAGQTLVFDADALNLLAKWPNAELECERQRKRQQQNHWILTPHPLEAARLLDCTTEQIQVNRVASVKRLAQKFDAIVILKGNGSLISNGTDVELCPLGNPGMAVGGMGDLLAGIICALSAKGMSGYEAACLAVYLHAQAADELAEVCGQSGVLPSAMLPFLSKRLG
ncbi:MAG: NAD(P)H-hydrate dehydratase [Thiotrichales bacterium]|nr:NAD(P)H-hydrate dehydratase [Thiotrichales bacterium]